MRAALEKKLARLKEELASGQRLMAELNTKQNTLNQTMLRISGAIQVLEEVLGEEAPPGEARGHEVPEAPSPR